MDLRNNLRKAGFDSAARRITATVREYRKCCRGAITVPGGVKGSYNRYQDAIKNGEDILSKNFAR